VPQRVEIDLAEGRTVAGSAEAVLGSPVRPLTADAMRGKFEMCWRAVSELPLDQSAALWNGISALETLEDVRVLAALTSPPRSRSDGKLEQDSKRLNQKEDSQIWSFVIQDAGWDWGPASDGKNL